MYGHNLHKSLKTLTNGIPSWRAESQKRMFHTLLRATAAAADLAVAPAFASPGFRLRAATWSKSALEVDLRGREILVTGANSGIGLAASEAFARRGATVHMLCRSRERGEQAAHAIAREGASGAVRVHSVDLERLDSIRSFARKWAKTGAPIHGLVHNAGAMFHRRELSPDGIERTFALHVLGPFALTQTLAPYLEAGHARIVFVSSGGMYGQRLAVDDLQFARGVYDGVNAYARAKRAQVLLAERMNDRWAPRGVQVSAMHPGWVDTEALRRSLPRFRTLLRPFLRDAAQGADTVVWLVASPEASQSGGRFWFDRMARRTHVPLAKTRSPREDVDRLWEECVRLSGGKEAAK
jgi:dehydrogenase/reductase SDR family protein 12